MWADFLSHFAELVALDAENDSKMSMVGVTRETFQDQEEQRYGFASAAEQQ
jgi:hypothetical protein